MFIYFYIFVMVLWMVRPKDTYDFDMEYWFNKYRLLIISLSWRNKGNDMLVNCFICIMSYFFIIPHSACVRL